MTDEFNKDNPEHRRIRLGIEQGAGISNMVRISEGLEAFKDAGFEILRHVDLATRPDAVPWYYPLAGAFKHLGSVWDLFAIARMTWWGRGFTNRLVGAGEKIGLFPRGSRKTAESLALSSDCLVEGAQKKLFTPMYLMVGRKPE